MARTLTIRTNLRIAVLILLACFLPSAHAAQNIRTLVDLSEQRMYLFVDGSLQATWKVSTARRGYRTPVGAFRPIRLERYWRSRKYDMAPMPHSVFFLGGYAIHGTNEIRRLGRPVSHGCIRLHPRNAAHLFRLIREAGRRNVRIIIRR
jgi:lipoprotein-anchoring transpeptidase ErfK/SrfK